MAENQESTTSRSAESSGASAAPGAAKPAADAPRPERSERPAGHSSGGDSRGPRPGGDRRPRQGNSGGKRFFRRRKVDFFSVNKIDDINYKDADSLKQFLGDRGKILPRRHTGLSAYHQRQLRRAIKRARNIALLPFAGEIKKGK